MTVTRVAGRHFAMAQVLEGERLESVRTHLADVVKDFQDYECMNYLAFLNYVIEKNKQFGLGRALWG